uniref:Uncharacterized protein n=1 Tax=Candidatus Methanogaster sp. ANME-2c ERB4 TaxID=2759911 RepID=A0A7G9Y2L6_9EURY|nr:hypothetical protein LDHBDEKG_00001 [Methanosarcinales archaeon ANME-2c ERB4]
MKGTDHWSDDALDGLESIARAGGEGPEGNAVAEAFVDGLKELYGDEYTQKIAKGVKELQEREITDADKLPKKIGKATNSLSNLKGIAFEVEVATDSRYIDDVAEVRRDIPEGEIDILFKNDDIIEESF